MTKVYCSNEPTCSNNSFEEKLASIVGEFSFLNLRERAVEDADSEKLKNIHDRMGTLRTRYLRLLPASNCIREKILQLKKNQNTATEEAFYSTYIQEINANLTLIVEDSFEDEYRKVEINLGLVDSVAELLIVEVEVFDFESPNHPNARPIRKAIGNALTNLTYGNMQCKRHLCEYPKFLETVVKIINNVPNLAQVYAALIRNLSWLADTAMGDMLATSVPALTKAAIRSSQTGDEKCLLATLSALWNLASHSPDNKREMCENQEFLQLLITLLSTDLRHISLIESASGIIKYISAYIVQKSDLVKKVHELKIIRNLLKLLHSSSFTVIANSLGALNHFSAWDSITQKKLLQDPPAMNFLNGLRNSTREDIRTSAKSVLNHLHNVNFTPSYAFTLPSRPQLQEMQDPNILSYDSSSLYRRTRNERLLAQRQPYYPNMHFPQLNDLKSPTFSTQSTSRATTNEMMPNFQPSSSAPRSNMLIQKVESQQIYHTTASYSINAIPNEFGQMPTENGGNAVKFRSSSLPRYSILSPAKSIIRESSEPLKSPDENDPEVKGLGPVHHEIPPPYESEFITEPVIEAGQEVSESMLCTRSASAQSLTSVDIQNASGWESRISTVENSNNISPGSCSDIPASPSECMVFLRSADVSRSKLEPESPNISIDEPKDDDVLYSSNDNPTNDIDDALLSNVIASVIPKPTSPRNTDSSSSTLKRDKRGSIDGQKALNYDEENDRFLLESIASVLPSPQKEPAGPQKLASVKPSLLMKTFHKGGFSPKSSPTKFEHNGSASKTLFERYKNKTSEHSSSNTGPNEKNGNSAPKERALNEDTYNKSDGSSGSTVDGTLPEDVDFDLKSEQVLIDCRKVNNSASRLPNGDTPKTRKSGDFKERNSRSRLQAPRPVDKSKISGIPRSSPSRNNPMTTSASRRSPYAKPRDKPAVPPKPNVVPKRPSPLKKSAHVRPFNYKSGEMTNSSETSDLQTSTSSSTKEPNDKKIGKMLVSAV